MAFENLLILGVGDINLELYHNIFYDICDVFCGNDINVKNDIKSWTNTNIDDNNNKKETYS